MNVVVNPALLIRLVEQSKVLAIDLETTGLDPRRDRIRLISVATVSCGQVYSAVADCFRTPEVLLELIGLLNNSSKILIAHNAAFDLSFLWAVGLTTPPETICTMLTEKVLTAGEASHGFPEVNLKACVLRRLEQRLDKGLQKADWSETQLSEEHYVYARKDAEILLPLLQKQNVALTEAKLHAANDLEQRALRTFVWLRMSGVAFDSESWSQLHFRTVHEKVVCGRQLERFAPLKNGTNLFGDARELWNWDSPQQVTEVLGKLGVDVATTNDAQLAFLEGDFPRVLRDYRGLSQRVKMYGLGWLEHADIYQNRLYPNWEQLGTASGRTSCRAPNVQQIPRIAAYRLCFRAPSGRTLLKSDYATLQMRIGCNHSREKKLFQVFASGGDPHTETGKAVLEKSELTKDERQIAKSLNFGLLFGMSPEGLRIYVKTTFGLTLTKDQAKQLHSKFFQVHPDLKRWHQRAYNDKSRETRTRAGRRRLLPEHASSTWRLNTPVQGDEADGLKNTLRLLWERRSEVPGFVPVLIVHDEIVAEVDPERAETQKQWLADLMAEGMEPTLAPVPVKVDAKIVPTWGD